MDKKQIKTQISLINTELKDLDKRQKLLNSAKANLTALMETPAISTKEVPGAKARGGRGKKAAAQRSSARTSVKQGRKSTKAAAEKPARGAKKAASRSLALVDTRNTDGRRRAPGQPTARDQIRGFMDSQKGSVEINAVREAFPNIKKSLVYATLSALTRGGEFKRNSDGTYAKA